MSHLINKKGEEGYIPVHYDAVKVRYLGKESRLKRGHVVHLIEDDEYACVDRVYKYKQDVYWHIKLDLLNTIESSEGAINIQADEIVGYRQKILNREKSIDKIKEDLKNMKDQLSDLEKQIDGCEEDGFYEKLNQTTEREK